MCLSTIKTIHKPVLRKERTVYKVMRKTLDGRYLGIHYPLQGGMVQGQWYKRSKIRVFSIYDDCGRGIFDSGRGISTYESGFHSFTSLEDVRHIFATEIGYNVPVVVKCTAKNVRTIGMETYHRGLSKNVEVVVSDWLRVDGEVEL